jgi:hypothetical protein
MNDAVIENLLSRAPSPEPPADLLRRLQSQIVLPKSPRPVRDPNGWQNPVRRWMPALAFGLFLLTCVVIVGVQANLVFRLQRENESLRTASADLETLKQGSDSAQLPELAQLRADNADLLRLRAEIAALRKQADELARLKAENERLAIATLPTNGPAETPEQRAQRESIECDMHLRQIGLAVRVWSQDYDGYYPTNDIMEMTNELGTANVLFCPSDRSHEREVRRFRITMPEFNSLPHELISYKFILSGQKDGEAPTRIIARCPIHGHVLLADGAVVTNAAASGRFREVTIDGRLNLIRADQGNANPKP